MSYRIIQADLLKYLRDHQWIVQRGYMPKYHAVICDPPYFLGSIVKRFGAANAAPAKDKDGLYQRLSGGFMGQTWDGFDSPQAYQAWVTEWATLMLDFVYPGAVLMAFGGTRTYHRLVCGLEDAGWEIYDSIIAWTYGCISEDTEILTEDGWEFYSPDILNKRILCYNKDMDVWQWEKPYHVSKYDYSDTAYRIQSDTTDQLVSRNHRCLIEREGTLLFEFAEDLARESEIRVPVLEDVSWLQQAVYDTQQHAGITEQILSGVSEQRCSFTGSGLVNSTRDIQAGNQATERTCLHVGCLPDLRQGILQTECVGQEGETALVQRNMQGASLFGVTGAPQTFTTDCLSGAHGLDSGVSEVCKYQNDGREQSGMEGRRYLPQAQGQLCESINQVCTLPTGIHQHGTQRRLCNGASSHGCSGDGQTIDANRSSTPYQSQRRGQSARELNALSEQSRTQVVRRGWRPPTALARITSVHYEGLMWCPTVPSGAFVARRNGKIFVTGNSGFPKSTAIGKMIDKQAGMEREILSVVKGGGRLSGDSDYQSTDYGSSWNGVKITAPATPEAAQYEGYGTSLAPSYEPIVIARAPRQGHTYADCALRFGTGAINVDGSRIGVDESDPNKRQETGGYKPIIDEPEHIFGKGMYSRTRPATLSLGRWPKNTILTHHPACTDAQCVPVCHVRVMGEQSGELTSGARTGQPAFIGGKGIFSGSGGRASWFDASTGTAARFFAQFRYVPKTANWERDAGLGDYPLQNVGMMEDDNYPIETGSGNLRDTKRRNPHPTVKPIQLLEYLANLLKPPIANARLFVPFSGSGSEMIGAMLAGWNDITGIEQSGEYILIARARLKWWAGFDTYEQARASAQSETRGKVMEQKAQAAGQLSLFDMEAAS